MSKPMAREDYEFNDSEFLGVDDKHRVLRDWERFLRLGMKYKNFSKLLYKHLTFHCSFIGHYSRQGFHAVYFGRDRQKTIQFLSQFDRNHKQGLVSIEYGGSWWLTGEYSDINNAMCDVATTYAPQCYDGLETEAMLHDVAIATGMLKKWGVEYTLEFPERFRSEPNPVQTNMF